MVDMLDLYRQLGVDVFDVFGRPDAGCIGGGSVLEGGQLCDASEARKAA